MKISEQKMVEKTFDFHVYGSEGNVQDTVKVTLREISSVELAALQQKCVFLKDGTKIVDENQQNWLVAASIIKAAPFESEANIPWAQMGVDERKEFISKLSMNHAVQINRFLQEMVPELSRNAQNLSKPS